jgi:hypothetical protein
MAKQPAPSDPRERPRPPRARATGIGRPWDRYDTIGAAIVLFLVALWGLHFLLPAPPPTNVP